MRTQPNSRSSRIYNTKKGTVVESRNVPFIESPQGARRMLEDERHHDELAGRA